MPQKRESTALHYLLRPVAYFVGLREVSTAAKFLFQNEKYQREKKFKGNDGKFSVLNNM
jgi:hypothetical protein